jgi:hypothetical protein
MQKRDGIGDTRRAQKLDGIVEKENKHFLLPSHLAITVYLHMGAGDIPVRKHINTHTKHVTTPPAPGTHTRPRHTYSLPLGFESLEVGTKPQHPPPPKVWIKKAKKEER